MAGGGALLAASRPIAKEPSAHQKPISTNPENRGKMADREAKLRTQKDFLCVTLQAEPQPHCPDIKHIMMSHWDQISTSLFGLRGIAA